MIKLDQQIEEMKINPLAPYSDYTQEVRITHYRWGLNKAYKTKLKTFMDNKISLIVHQADIEQRNI